MVFLNCLNLEDGRGQLNCDGSRAETRFRLSAKRTSPFKSAGALVQSTTGSRAVRISGSNAGYTMFRGSVKSTEYCLPTPFASFPFTSPPVRHRVPSRFYWTLPLPIGHHCAHEEHLVSECPVLLSLSLEPKELSASIPLILNPPDHFEPEYTASAEANRSTAIQRITRIL